MQVQTTLFGTVEIDDQQCIHFPEGILGFTHLTRFLLIEHPGGPFKWLQAVDAPEVAFPTLNPAWVCSNYEIRLEESEIETLGLGADAGAGDVSVLAIVNVSTPTSPTINLMAPICVAVETRRGIQAVQHNRSLSTRHPLRARQRGERRVA